VMWILRLAVTVMLMSPFAPTLSAVLVRANDSALYDVIFPVVGFEDASVTTWSAPETNQFCRMVLSASADATSIVNRCDFPSVRRGTNGVRSDKYISLR
jgi:hypothetical protein